MRRLIDADEAMRHIVKEYNRARTGEGLRLAWIEKAINDTPTAEPRVGRWEFTDYGGFGNWHCTACRKIAVVNGCENYCPNCGAHMEG